MSTAGGVTSLFAEFEPRSGSAVVGRSPTLGRQVRLGSLAEQQASTHALLLDALAGGRQPAAIELLGVYAGEQRFTGGWLAEIGDGVRAALLRWGASPEAVAAELGRIRGLLAGPDGRPLDPERDGAAVVAGLRAATAAAREGDLPRARESYEDTHVAWRRLHDRLADEACGLLDVVRRRHGDARIPQLWRELSQRQFAERYGLFDVSRVPWERSLPALLYLTFEAGRAHLVGPGRHGDADIVDDGDRFVVVWDPCGTCGRMVRGDEVEGTPPRPEPPYRWGVVERAYDWTRGRAGTPPYNVQSCVKLEQAAIDAFGYPIRVHDCPTYPDRRDAPCYRYLYKDPSLVPAEYYERVGRERPAELGSAGRRGG